MKSHSFPPWLNDGEKYALVGLSLKFDGAPSFEQLTPHLWALSGSAVSVPQHWREWLGSVRVEEVEDCNLFLLSKLESTTPGVLNGENRTLQRRVSNFYAGLLLASTFAPAHRPVLLSGARQAGEIDIRQQQDMDSPIPFLFRPYPTITPDEIGLAARLGENLEILAAAAIPAGHWRLFRTLRVYTAARTMGDIIDRIHQYCRCIDGLILPEPGKTKQQFRSRTELFIGASHHELMGTLYDIRSDGEHLHEYRYLETFEREARLDLIVKEAIAECIARSALARVIGNESLWGHFANTPALESFWSRTQDERQHIWGGIIDPMTAVADFDPKYITDGELGAQ